MSYECLCGYVYDETKGDPEHDIPAGTKWEDLPAGFACPICSMNAEDFKKILSGK